MSESEFKLSEIQSLFDIVEGGCKKCIKKAKNQSAYWVTHLIWEHFHDFDNGHNEPK